MTTLPWQPRTQQQELPPSIFSGTTRGVGVLRRRPVAGERADDRGDAELVVLADRRLHGARDLRRRIGEGAPLAGAAGHRDVGVRRQVHADAERAQLLRRGRRARRDRGARALADVDLCLRREVAEGVEVPALLLGGNERRRMAGLARDLLQLRRQPGELLGLLVVVLRQQQAAVGDRGEPLEKRRVAQRAAEADEEQAGDGVAGRALDLLLARRRRIGPGAPPACQLRRLERRPARPRRPRR